MSGIHEKPTKASLWDRLKHAGERVIGYTNVAGETGAAAIQAYENRMARLGEEVDVGVIIQFMIYKGKRTYAADPQGKILTQNINSPYDFTETLKNNENIQLRTLFPDGTSHKLDIIITD